MASLKDILAGKRDLPVPGPEKIQPPPEIDFSALWEDPEEDNGTGLLKILTFVNTAVLMLVLILGFFGK